MDLATDGRIDRGDRTRRQILDVAVDLASTGGLGGLSIGALAQQLGMSKSGLFACFGSKEELQLSVVERASDIFIDEVVRKGLAHPRGLQRLQGLCEAWLTYAEGNVFSGGCFFFGASAEFDSKPGRVRDLIAAKMAEWLRTLALAVRAAQSEGHLDPEVDPEQLAFELNSVAFGANWTFQLHRDHQAFARARRAIRSLIDHAAGPLRHRRAAPPRAAAPPGPRHTPRRPPRARA